MGQFCEAFFQRNADSWVHVIFELPSSMIVDINLRYFFIMDSGEKNETED